jgi:ribulose-phosphate 3-epimerase
MEVITMKKKIIPAIIAKNQNELDERLSRVIGYVDVVQLDVMDNKFVPNSSLFFDFSLPQTNCKFEAHLMVEDPQEWVEKNGNKVDMILVHFESNYDLNKILMTVKNIGKKVGFVLNPETPIEKLRNFLDELDQVLIMAVNPGFYGSLFLPEMLEKIRRLRFMKKTLDIEVDGGITDKTIELVDQAGANMFVSGSFIVKADNVNEAINNLKNKLRED